MTQHALYRFYDRDGHLLYIGITNSLPRRLQQHDDTKPWWDQVAQVDVEHHPGRPAVLAAERAAIIAEQPRFNVHHNRRPVSAPRTAARGRWRFRTLRSGWERTADLWLYPELDCSSIVDDHFNEDGPAQLDAYVRYLERRFPEWLDQDAVPIYWSVVGTVGVHEAAPFQADPVLTEDFLSHYTWPIDAATGERLDWYRLPVVNDRFPDFADALGWTPSPLQPTCPLGSILAARRGARFRPLRRAS